MAYADFCVRLRPAAKRQKIDFKSAAREVVRSALALRETCTNACRPFEISRSLSWSGLWNEPAGTATLAARGIKRKSRARLSLHFLLTSSDRRNNPYSNQGITSCQFKSLFPAIGKSSFGRIAGGLHRRTFVIDRRLDSVDDQTAFGNPFLLQASC